MIDFLKKYSLPIGLKRSIKNNIQKDHRSISYDDSDEVLLFFTSEGNQKFALIKGLQNKLKKEGKKVSCLYLLLHDDDKPDAHMDDGMLKIDPSDFSLFGQMLKPEVEEMLNKEFDFLIHLDMESNIYTDLVMTKSKAKCRIGRFFDEHINQYDMMIKVSDDKKMNYFVDQIYHYTKAL